MPRWVFAAAVLTLAVAFPATPARAGWFSHHGGCHDDCAPTCGAPIGCYTEPSCGIPVGCAPVCEPSCCAPVAPTCAVPVYGGCGDVCYDECEKECCLKRCLSKLWNLEKRKNRCLKDRLFGGHGHGCHDECAPIEYYQPSCGAPVYPSCGAPAGCF